MLAKPPLAAHICLDLIRECPSQGGGGGSAGLFDMLKVGCSNPRLTTSQGLHITPGAFQVYSWRLQWTTELASFSKVSQIHRINVNIVNPMKCLVHCVINFLQKLQTNNQKDESKTIQAFAELNKKHHIFSPNNKHTLFVYAYTTQWTINQTFA